MPVPGSSPSLKDRHPISIRSPALAPGPTGLKLGYRGFPLLPPHLEHPFLPVPDVAHGRCGPSGAGSGCLPWLPPCLDFSPVTNPCPGPSALPANSSAPSLPALMSSRLSALPENLPGHAARLHLRDLVTISSPWGWGGSLLPSTGGLASGGRWRWSRPHPQRSWCPMLKSICGPGNQKKGIPFSWRW